MDYFIIFPIFFDMFLILYPMMSRDKDIKNLIKVEEARVPVIKFEMDGFEFDLAMSRAAGLSILIFLRIKNGEKWIILIFLRII